MKKNLFQAALLTLVSILVLQGCLLDVTSVVVPSSISSGEVITVTVTGTAASTGAGHRGGIVLQVPSGTAVLRVHYLYTLLMEQRGFLTEDPAIGAGYTAEPGYHLSSWAASGFNDGNTSVTLTVWLSVPSGVTPGVYTVKTAVGVYDQANTWVPQNPQVSGSPVTDFSQISGKYVSNPIIISAGVPDSTPPAVVDPAVSDSIVVNLSAYDETAQGDVAKYRVYLSKGDFNSVVGRQLLDSTTKPSVTGNSVNTVMFSSDIGTGLFYFEVPPGAEYPITMNGLTSDVYYFAVTAVDLSGNESSLVVTPFLRGSISGRVTDGTVGIQGISVDVSGTSGTVSTVTAADGTYTVTGLLAGGYKVAFVGSQGYPTQWYNHKPNSCSADIVTVSAPSTATGIDAVLTLMGRISGRVTDSAARTGIQNVTVAIYGHICSPFLPPICMCNWSRVTSAVTDLDGNYTTEQIPDGSYKVEFVGSQGYLTQWYDGKAQVDNGIPDNADLVTVKGPNTTTRVNAVMALGGRISGRVTNGTTGIQGIQVFVHDTAYVWMTTPNATTAADGTYTVSGLRTGIYKVEFQGSPEYARQWYNNKASADSADLVAVTAPNATTGINFVLSPSGGISGRVTNGTTGIQTTVIVHDTNNNVITSAPTSTNGTYMVSGLLTGSYKVEFVGSQGYVTQWYNNKADSDGADLVPVTGPDTTTGIDAVMALGGSISGRVTNGSTGIQDIQVVAYDTKNNEVAFTVTGPEGFYTIIGVPTGSYRLLFRSSPRYLERWYDSKPDRGSADPVSVTSPATTTGIDAILGSAAISGRVTDSGTGTGIENITVEVYMRYCPPLPLPICSWKQVMSTVTDATGSFTAAGVEGGTYEVHFGAAAAGYVDQWYDNKTDETSANWITVAAGSTTERIDARLSKATQFGLTVVKKSTGKGVVRSSESPRHIDCGNTCSYFYNSGNLVTLIATANPGSLFSGWTGCDTAKGNQCTVTMSASRTVTATFTRVPPKYSLVVQKQGTGKGTVNSVPGGISCGADCSNIYDPGTAVTLSAVPETGYTFAGWSGRDCSGTGTCTVTLRSNTVITAHFECVLPLPAKQEVFTYDAVMVPEMVCSAAELRPIGVGRAATGKPWLSLAVEMPAFEGKVDYYLAFYAPDIEAENVYLMRPDGSLVPLKGGVIPWMTGVESSFRRMPWAEMGYIFGINVPSGQYLVGLLAVQEGETLTGPFYFWMTSFKVR